MDDLKAQLKQLDFQKKQIETELDVRYGRLLGPNGPGLSGNLVDAEGYPRADIDILEVRQDRQRVSELQNDLKNVIEKISDLLERLHSVAREAGSVRQKEPSNSTMQPISDKLQMADYVPFAVVDEVAENSPASEAGIQVGDQLCLFGSVTHLSRDKLPSIANVLQTNENKIVKTVFLRNDEIVAMDLIPRKWNGRGLLGCHIVPK
eukprot:TRINITY_DN11403_c0_g1_i1.p2 TRINITY_DN11403_c0_g1~~TRINITY_DN11403_c0_g1_i1.p2  ORF type:complete len:233 (-),score=27.81 TRINITY_DN11403_c0_g1_i1:402-1019(-)